jgi:DNA-binding response OmpR family regulator
MRVSSDLYYDEPRVMLIGSKGVHLLTKGQQILFSTLLRAGGAPVSAQTLAMRLAGDSLVPRQVKTVRNAISRLRRDLAKITPTVRVANRYAIGYYIHVDSPAPRDA